MNELWQFWPKCTGLKITFDVFQFETQQKKVLYSWHFKNKCKVLNIIVTTLFVTNFYSWDLHTFLSKKWLNFSGMHLSLWWKIIAIIFQKIVYEQLSIIFPTSNIYFILRWGRRRGAELHYLSMLHLIRLFPNLTKKSNEFFES